MLPKCFLKWSRIYLKWRFLSCNKSISSWSYKSGICFSRRHDFGESPVKDISHGRRKPGAGNFEILVILTFKYSDFFFQRHLLHSLQFPFRCILHHVINVGYWYTESYCHILLLRLFIFIIILFLLSLLLSWYMSVFWKLLHSYAW